MTPRKRGRPPGQAKENDDKLMYVLRQLRGPNGLWPSNAYLAKATGKSVRTVQRCLKRLRETKQIRTQQKHYRRERRWMTERFIHIERTPGQHGPLFGKVFWRAEDAKAMEREHSELSRRTEDEFAALKRIEDAKRAELEARMAADPDYRRKFLAWLAARDARKVARGEVGSHVNHSPKVQQILREAGELP